MIKNYDPNISWGAHLIKITFQQWTYRGYITVKKGGKTKGLMILAIDIDDLYDSTFEENTANLEIMGQDYFRMTLVNDLGDELEIEDDWDNLGDFIVGLEILTFEKE